MQENIEGVQRPVAGEALMEPRLWGTWRSDRRKTFANYKPARSTSPARDRKFRSLFGKLTVHWTRKTMKSWFAEGTFAFPASERPTIARYEVLARSEYDVVVLTRRRSTKLEALCHLPAESVITITFEDDGYWVMTMLNSLEYFRRVRS